MMNHPEACTALTRMEARLRETRHNLFELERSLREHAEDAYLHILDRLIRNAAADLDRLQRKIERQDEAIKALRQKYRVNAARPIYTPL